jgi:hypothetical protein
MSLSEYEKAQLALLERQARATEENTAALQKLREPLPVDLDADARQLAAIRKGGKPQDIRYLTGPIALTDSGKGGSGEVIATVQLRAHCIFDAKSPSGRIFDLEFPTEAAIPFLEKVWDADHSAFVSEAAKRENQRVAAVDARSTWVKQALYWRVKLPILQLVGRDVDKVGHVCKLEPEAMAAQ